MDEDIIKSSQSPARTSSRVWQKSLFKINEDSPVRHKSEVVWETRSTPVREKHRLVGNNFKQRSSEIQPISKRPKRHHSSPVLKQSIPDEDDEEVQKQRLENFRKLIFGAIQNEKNENVPKKETESFEIDFDEWDKIEAEAAKRLESSQPKSTQNLDSSEEDIFLTAVPSEVFCDEMSVVDPLPSTSVLSKELSRVIKTAPLIKEDVQPTTSLVASKEEIERKRLEAIRRREETLKKTKTVNILSNFTKKIPSMTSEPSTSHQQPPSETPEEIRQRIERNRQEALRKQQEMKLKKSSELPKVAPQTSNHQNEIKHSTVVPGTNQTKSNITELSEEDRQRIERNKQEALRKQQEMKLKKSLSPTSLNPSTIPQQQKEVKLNIPTDSKVVDPKPSATEISEEDRLRIERNRQEALRKQQEMKLKKSSHLPLELPKVTSAPQASNHQNEIKPTTSTIAQAPQNPKHSTEMSEEDRQRIEKNKQEALRRQQERKNSSKINPQSIELTHQAETSSSSKKNEDIQMQIEKNKQEALRRRQESLKVKNLNQNEARAAPQVSIDENTRKIIEEKKLEALRRQEMWRKSQKKTS